MRKLFEHGGVLLEVEYTPGSDAEGGPTIISVRALGDNYAPAEPDLTGLLQNLLVLEEDGAEMQYLFSKIAEEVEE